MTRRVHAVSFAALGLAGAVCAGSLSCSLATSLDGLRASDAGAAVADAADGDGGSAETGCGDLTSDPGNCGACGHSCLGASCDNGMCAPVVLASGQANPDSIAVTGGVVYWAVLRTGAVLSCPTSGCGSGPSTVASVAGAYTLSLVVDGTTAYFSTKLSANVNAGSIYSCPIGGCGGAPTLLASAQNHPVFLALDPTNVYWTAWGDGHVAYCARGGCGGTPTVLATQAAGPNVGPNGISVAGGAAYWVSDDGQVRKCSVAGCATPTVLASGQNQPWSIATDATSAYWTNQGGSVMKCTLSGCNNSPSLLISGEGGPQGIALDASSVYWTDATSGTVRACSPSDCVRSVRTLASGLVQPSALALDDTSVYVAVFGTPGNANGAVLKIAK